MLSRSPTPAIAAVSALLLALEQHLDPREARELVADMLAADKLSEKAEVWIRIEAKLPPRSTGALRVLANPVVRLSKRAANEALAELLGAEPGVSFMDLGRHSCRYVLVEAVPTIWSARYCGASAVKGLSWCPEHKRKVCIT